MKEAIDTLNLIASTNSTPKTIKKSVTDLVTDLVKENIHFQLGLQIQSVY